MNYLASWYFWLFPDFKDIAKCLETREKLKKTIITLESAFRYGVMNDSGPGFEYKPNDPVIFNKLLEAKHLLRRIEDRLKLYSPEEIKKVQIRQ